MPDHQLAVFTYRIDSANQSSTGEYAATKALLLATLKELGCGTTSTNPDGAISLANSWHAFLASSALVNHFPRSVLLTHKHLCARTLKGSPWYPYPSYVLPEDAHQLQRDVADSTAPALLIIKPGRHGGGRGVMVLPPEEYTARAAALSTTITGPTIACRYVDRPLLIAGVKSDLRLYVLVKEGWSAGSLFTEGLVRFASAPYTAARSSLPNAFVHLTNNAVNRKADGGSGKNAPRNWTLTRFFAQLEQLEGVLSKDAARWRPCRYPPPSPASE